MPYSTNAAQAAVVTVQSILGRRNDYKRGIEQNEENTKLFAATLMENLGPALEDCCQDDDLNIFLQAQKKRLVELTEEAVKQHRQVDSFCESLRNIQGSMNEDDINYETRIGTEMRKLQRNRNKNHLDMSEEPTVREMQKMLDLFSESSTLENCDLEILPQQNSQSLKCPLTLALFEDPVKNRVCHHVYSRKSLEDYIKQNKGRNCKCPVAGCSNVHLTMASCVPDPTTAMRVKKQQRITAKEQEIRMSQAASIDSDEEGL